MSTGFKYDKINVTTNDIQRVQTKPTVYIPYTEEDGGLHLCKEIINNIIDENENENSPCTGGILHYDQSEDTFYAEDNGRGIPFDDLLSACTILHSGSKELRDQGGDASAGENGMGITVVNALSEIFEITSYIGGQARVIKFRDGELVSDKIVPIANKDKHGLAVKFKPSKTFLGKKAKIPVTRLEDWLLKTSFVMPSGITFKYSSTRTGKEVSNSIVFKNKNGIAGFLPKCSPTCDLLKTPLVFSNHISITENDVPVRIQDPDDPTKTKVELKSFERYIELNVAMNYDSNSNDTVQFAFTNCIWNIRGGKHMDAALSAFVSFMRKKVKSSFNKKESKLTVSESDILSGLNIVVSINTTLSTKFVGQGKEILGNEAFFKPVKDMMDEALVEYFRNSDTKKTLNRLIDFIKMNIKARMESTKVKTKVKQSTSFVDDREIPGYVAPGNIREKGAYREIYIVEGDSAGGNARSGRYDNNIQGLFKLRGKPTNVYDSSYLEIKAKQLYAIEYKNMFKAFGTGMGPDFVLEDLLFDKIIIGSDADIDGEHIDALLASGFLKYATPLVEDGRLYRGVTPLYRRAKVSKNSRSIKDRFILDKNEFFEIFEKTVSDKIRLKITDDGDFITKEQMRKFLSTNRDYYQLLDMLRNQYLINPDILEYIAYNPNFREEIGELDCELVYDKETDAITGAYNGEFTNLILENVLMKEIKYLTDVIYKGNNGQLKFYMYENYKHRDTVFKGYLTIGQIMANVQGLEPPIDTRFKGWGELEPDELCDVAMDPNQRVLIRLTVDDLMEAIDTFDDLFMQKRVAARKQMIENAEISIDDIDN